MQLGIGYTVTTDCLMVYRIVRLNLNWKKENNSIVITLYK